MAASQDAADISVYTIGGTSFLGDVSNVTYIVEAETEDGSTIGMDGKSMQITKQSARIETGFRSTVSGSTRVTNLSISAFSIGGTSFAASLRGGSFEARIITDEASGVKDVWKYPQAVKKSYRAVVRLSVPESAIQPIMAAYHDDPSSGEAAFSMTLGGTTITVPMVIKLIRHEMHDSKIQILEVHLEDRAEYGEAYPTGPSGTASLLAAAFNAIRTPVAVVLTTKASGGLTYSGNFIITGFGFSFNDSRVIDTKYSFTSQGVITAADPS